MPPELMYTRHDDGLTGGYDRKSVIGSNIHIEVNEFNSLWIVFRNDARRFGFSTRSLGHVMFSLLPGHFPRRKTLRDQDF